jgi:hypothetical protein
VFFLFFFEKTWEKFANFYEIIAKFCEISRKTLFCSGNLILFRKFVPENVFVPEICSEKHYFVPEICSGKRVCSGNLILFQKFVPENVFVPEGYIFLSRKFDYFYRKTSENSSFLSRKFDFCVFFYFKTLENLTFFYLKTF